MNSECGKTSQDKTCVRNCTKELLEEVGKSVRSLKECLVNATPKVKDADLSAELMKQIDKYTDFGAQIKGELGEACKEECKAKTVMGKMTAKLGVEMNTVIDSSDERIAQMLIESTTMEITDTIRLVRDYENSNCSEQALTLAKEVVSYEEKAVEKLKTYL